MKKFFKRFAIGILAFMMFASSVSALSGISNPGYFKKVGNAVYFVKTAYVLGDATHKIANGNFTLLTVGTLTVTGVTMAGNINMAGFDITAVDQIVGNTNLPVNIGDAGATSHTLTADDDLFVSGKFEADGLFFADTTATFGGNLNVSGGLFFGTASNSVMYLNATQTPDTIFIGVPTTGNSLIVGEVGDRTFDFAHALAANPTLFIHSTNQSTTQWIGLTHDGTNGVISTGTGDLWLNSAAVLNTTALGATTAPRVSVINTTAAADGVQQVSPSLYMRGNGWKTDATVASQPVDFQTYVLPIQGTAAPTANYVIQSRINNGSWANALVMSAGGAMTLTSGLTATAIAATTGGISSGGTASIALTGKQSDAAGSIAVKIGNTTSLTTAGAKIMAFYSDNVTTEKAFIGLNGMYNFSGSGAMTAANYQIGRNADATNLMNFNVPTGAGYEFGVNDVAQLVLNATTATFTPKIVATTASIQVMRSVANVSTPPTDAELDAAFGDPTAVGSGFIGVVDDNDAGTTVYWVYSTGTAGEWFHVLGTKAL